MIQRLLKKSIRILRERGPAAFLIAARRKLRIERRNRIYREWIRQFDLLTDDRRKRIKEVIERFDRMPLISVLMPVYNVDAKYLKEAIDSIREQLYPNWELCIADDRSPSPHVRKILEEYAATDARIKIVYRETNGHISAASNSALEIVTGEFTALMDHDDKLTEDALFQVAKLLNERPDVNMVYSDEDKIDAHGTRYQPMFKPDWSIELFRSLNLVTHLCVFRTAILRKIGGFRIGFEGSQDYDLSLRFVEQIDPRTIEHIPLVLYHWRAIPGSVALDSGEKSYAHEKAREAIREHFERLGVAADVTRGVGELHRTNYHVPAPEPTVTLIGQPGTDLERLLSNAGYGNVETIRAGDGPRFTSLNEAARSATGSVLVFVSHRVEHASDGWLRELVSRAIQNGVGPVGAKIASRSDHILNAGYFLGVSEGVGRPHLGYHAADQGEFERLAVDQNFSAVSVECMAISRDRFESARGFDADSFPENYGDIDLCLRLAGSGSRTLWTPWAKVTSSQEDELPMEEGLDRLRARWPEVFARDPFYNPNLTAAANDLGFAFPPRCSRA